MPNNELSNQASIKIVLMASFHLSKINSKFSSGYKGNSNSKFSFVYTDK